MANEISTLQSGPAKEPLIATFAIGALQHPRTTGGEQRNQHGRLAKIRAAPGCNPLTRRTSGTVEFGSKPQTSDIKPKVRGRKSPRRFSAFGPIFLQNCTLYWGCRFAGYGNKWPSQ